MTIDKQDDAGSQPGEVRSSDQLGLLPEPVAWFRAPYGTLEPNPLFRMTGPQTMEWAVACFTEDQLRAEVAAERERCAKSCERISQQYKDAPGSHALERAANAIRLGA